MTTQDEHVCPHCGQRMLMRLGVKLSPKQADLFDLIDRAGSRGGIAMEAIHWVLYPDKPKTAATKLIAVHVKQINDMLESTDWLIVGKRSHIYQLCSRQFHD